MSQGLTLPVAPNQMRLGRQGRPGGSCRAGSRMHPGRLLYPPATSV